MIKWRCDVCGQIRPDDKIDVFVTDISVEYDFPEGRATQNVRHCNDSPFCIEKAKNISFLMEERNGHIRWRR